MYKILVNFINTTLFNDVMKESLLGFAAVIKNLANQNSRKMHVILNLTAIKTF